MQHSFEEFSEKKTSRRIEVCWKFVAKTVLVESADQFSLKDTEQLELFFEVISSIRPSGKSLKYQYICTRYIYMYIDRLKYVTAMIILFKKKFWTRNNTLNVIVTM